jgi:hypothetical protein
MKTGASFLFFHPPLQNILCISVRDGCQTLLRRIPLRRMYKGYHICKFVELHFLLLP